MHLKKEVVGVAVILDIVAVTEVVEVVDFVKGGLFLKCLKLLEFIEPFCEEVVEVVKLHGVIEDIEIVEFDEAIEMFEGVKNSYVVECWSSC